MEKKKQYTDNYSTYITVKDIISNFKPTNFTVNLQKYGLPKLIPSKKEKSRTVNSLSWQRIATQKKNKHTNNILNIKLLELVPVWWGASFLLVFLLIQVHKR